MLTSRGAMPIFALALVVVAIALCIPLHLYPLSNYIEELWVALGVIFCSACLLWRSRGFRLSSWSLIWLVLGGLFLLSSVVHEAAFLSGKLFYLVFWFAGAGALLIGGQVDWQEKSPSLVFAWVMWGAALVCAVVGFLRHYGFLWEGAGAYIPLVSTGRMVGLIGHSNFFAFVCLVGVLCSAWLFQNKSIKLWVVLLVSPVFIFAIVLSGGRAVLVAWVALVFFLLLRRRALRADRYVFVVVLGFLALLVIQPIAGVLDGWLSALSSQPETLDARLFALGGRGVDSSGRWQEWQIAWSIFLSHPWFGVGVGNYAGASFDARLLQGLASPELFTHAHNSLLQLVVELGIPGLVWVLLTAVLCARGLWVGSTSVMRVLPVSVLFIFGVYSLFEFPLWIMHFLILNLLILGALGGNATKVNLQLGKLFSVVLAFLFVTVISIYGPLVERFYWSFKQYLQRAPVHVEEYTFMNAMIADPLMEPYGYLIYVANFQVSSRTAEKEVEVLERFRRYKPYVQVLARLAVLQVATDAVGKGQKTADEMRSYYGVEIADYQIRSQLREAESAFPGVDFSVLFSSSSARLPRSEGGANVPPAAGVAQ